MTPRHADVAYVLEAVAGVRGVFAVSTATHDFAVAVERGGGVLAEVHYALLRVLTYEEVQRVHVFNVDVPRFVERGRALALTEMDRAAARARVPAPPPRPPIVRPSPSVALRVLLVSEERDLEPIVRLALGPQIHCERMLGLASAIKAAKHSDFDVVLCAVEFARGSAGLLAHLPPDRASRVIVIAGARSEKKPRVLPSPLRLALASVDSLLACVLTRRALTPRLAAFAVEADAAYEPAPLARGVWPFRHLRILIASEDRTIERLVYDTLDPSAFCVREADPDRAIDLASRAEFDLILCDGEHAFGLRGMLARLSFDKGQIVVVIVEPQDADAAHRRLRAPTRVLVRPVTMDTLPLVHNGAFAAPKRASVTTPSDPRPPGVAMPETFTAVLIDVPIDVENTLRRILPIDARYLSRRDALLSPFHVAIVGARAALATESVLREAGAKAIVLAADDRDVAWTKHSLARDGHPMQRVLALPIDEIAIAREIHRDHPELTARVAIAETASLPAARVVARGRTRVLIVDDDITTQVLRAAATSSDDIILATTAMESFEAVASARIRLLIVSASMRSDGGEPLYRLLWRLEPELKARTILITAGDLGSPLSSVSERHSRRIVRRPLTTQVVSKIVEEYRADEIA